MLVSSWLIEWSIFNLLKQVKQANQRCIFFFKKKKKSDRCWRLSNFEWL